ncbi:phosphotransferase enzyme family protein-like protein [Boeremia exigua]|uniref:phosphotransferase enzyme family protein-like protein n=1 Tax=Boeremia exigua TaxID=749465 RepID=UPI001E8CAD38|nr:phosphotransferase enzyme family protein-like protein [Boeremia exigua]KAH6612114.1 phosphotransferase enzyme family protein-like protein [Boeremia exigua]
MLPSVQSDRALEISLLKAAGIPSGDDVDFHGSSFFQKHDSTSLPSPDVVREVASHSKDPKARLRTRPLPVFFPELGVCVKYGTEVTIAEGQCLLLIRSKLSQHVPVPEVYKWCKDDGQVFIYMELMNGVTLEKSWDGLDEGDRLAVCEQLRCMIAAWRGLGCTSDLTFIGHIGRQPLLDIIFESTCSPTAGPFLSVSEFHDYFTSSFGPRKHNRNRPPHPYRHFLPDDVPIAFTHADLHPSNILVSTGSTPRITAIIDWHQSGWYPAYWEYCKARWTSEIGSEWEIKYLPLIVDPHECYDYWDYFVLAHGT